MRLIPAHARDAKEMARGLCDQLAAMGFPFDSGSGTVQPLTLQQTHEAMARAMGYTGGWRELLSCLGRAHEPVYLDADSDGALLRAFVARLSAEVGVDYAHGWVFDAIQNSGAGYSPRMRRALAAKSSPWGIIQRSEEVVPGICQVSTATHGGFLVSPDRLAAMPAHLRLPGGAYEEDGEFHLLAVACPDYAAAHNIPMLEVLDYLDITEWPGTPSKPSTAQLAVVDYLVRCVLINRKPSRFPMVSFLFNDEDLFGRWPLDAWVDLFSKVPKVNGQWPIGNEVWHESWAWAARELARQEATAARVRAQRENRFAWTGGLGEGLGL